MFCPAQHSQRGQFLQFFYLCFNKNAMPQTKLETLESAYRLIQHNFVYSNLFIQWQYQKIKSAMKSTDKRLRYVIDMTRVIKKSIYVQVCIAWKSQKKGQCMILYTFLSYTICVSLSFIAICTPKFTNFSHFMTHTHWYYTRIVLYQSHTSFLMYTSCILFIKKSSLFFILKVILFEFLVMFLGYLGYTTNMVIDTE